jgi:transcription regulator MmyB-like protein
LTERADADTVLGQLGAQQGGDPAQPQRAAALLAYNRAMRMLITDLDDVPVARRNCAWLTFTERAGASASSAGSRPRHARPPTCASRWAGTWATADGRLS